MKYKVIGLLSAVLLIMMAFASVTYEPAPNRYHQHLEAQEKAPCTDHGEDVFCTHLPLINIETEQPVPDPYVYEPDGKVRRNPKNKRREANELMVHSSIQVFDSQTENNHLTDKPTFDEKGLFRIRGNTSREFDKKSYLVKFTQENYVDNKDIPLAGMTADSSWALHGPFLDKTLIRNYLCYNLAGEIMEYSPNVRFCELFLNGKYQGIYLIIEKINFNKDGRINLTKSDPKIPETSYILRIDDGLTDSPHKLVTFADDVRLRGMESRRYEHLQILYPGSTLTPAQHEYIDYDISKFERALTSDDLSDSKKGYAAYIDVDSFVNYFVLNEFLMNSDAGRISTYLAKDIRGKIKIISWDYNNVFNNYMDDLASPHRFYINSVYFNYLLSDEAFVTAVINKYSDLRQSFLSDEYLNKYIDDTIEYLGPAIERNFKKWGYSFQQDLVLESSSETNTPIRNPRNYDEAIDSLKENIHQHGKFLDDNIDSLHSHCQFSSNNYFKDREDEY